MNKRAAVLRESNRTDIVTTLVMVGVFVSAIVVIMVMLLPDNPVPAAVLAVGCLLALVRWHSRTFGYRCPNCGYDFETGMLRDLVSFQGVNKTGGWRLLRCPSCKKIVKAREMTKVKTVKVK